MQCFRDHYISQGYFEVGNYCFSCIVSNLDKNLQFSWHHSYFLQFSSEVINIEDPG